MMFGRRCFFVRFRFGFDDRFGFVFGDRVGELFDDTVAGAIYRIAPKGFVSKAPAFDASTIEGLITALRSPAVNVRAIGFEGLRARGAESRSAVSPLQHGGPVLHHPFHQLLPRAVGRHGRRGRRVPSGCGG